MNGIIIKAISGFYYVLSDKTVYECKARGNFRQSGVSPLAGDKVEFNNDGEQKGVITAVLPRKNFLSRPPIANIDKLFIVSAFENPAPNTYLIDKITAFALYKNIEPIVVFNKSDMGDFSKLQAEYEKAGFKTYIVSAKTLRGTEELKSEFSGCICAFTGNSGVGKSSILNSLFPELSLETGDISLKLGRGRHTTRHTELIKVGENEFVADTPGFSSFDGQEEQYDFKTKLIECFPDLYKHSFGCKFNSCTHTGEKGCEVISQVACGQICQSRYDSYSRIFSELKELKPWQAKKK